jgi:predicted nucleic acid-binding protein
MSKQRLYLETSVWNFYFADDVPEKKEATINFFEKIKNENFEINISEIVFKEIRRASENKQKLLFNLINQFNPIILKPNEQTNFLAEKYIEEGALGKNNIEDANHAAIATINKIDILLSWNMKHLANFRRMIIINEINKRYGYRKLILTTP